MIELRLRRKGLTVLGIQKNDGGYNGSPDANALIELDDVITLYGESKSFVKLRELQEQREAENAEKEKE